MDKEIVDGAHVGEEAVQDLSPVQVRLVEVDSEICSVG